MDSGRASGGALSSFSRVVAVLLVAMVCAHLVRRSLNDMALDDRTLPEATKARLQTVADLMLDIYETMARMRYIDPGAILRGPHGIDSLRPLYAENDLDATIVYLYSILPYVDTELVGPSDAGYGESFANYLRYGDINQGRDPYFVYPIGDDYDYEDGPYMRPWYTTLSYLVLPECPVVYDARHHRIWIINFHEWYTCDLTLQGTPQEAWLQNVCDMDELGRDENRNTFTGLPCRPAEAVLRDINTWLVTLQVLPGAQSNEAQPQWAEANDSGDAEVDAGLPDLRALYQRHGWPSKEFDGDGFLVDLARRCCAIEAMRRAVHARNEVKKYEDWLAAAVAAVERGRYNVERAVSLDEEWRELHFLWTAQRRRNLHAASLRAAQEKQQQKQPEKQPEKQPAAGSVWALLPFWELRVLEEELKAKEEDAAGRRRFVLEILPQEQQAPLQAAEAHEQHVLLEQLRMAEEDAAVYRKACAASRADVERLLQGHPTLQTGDRLLQSQMLSLLEHEREEERMLQREADATAEWAATIPSEAADARQYVGGCIRELVESLDSCRARIRRLEEAIAAEQQRGQTRTTAAAREGRWPLAFLL